MKIILDTDKKTITVPWNYSDKLAAMNKIIESAGGEKLEFVGYIDNIWKEAMSDTDKYLVTAKKPNRKG